MKNIYSINFLNLDSNSSSERAPIKFSTGFPSLNIIKLGIELTLNFLAR